MSNTSLRVIVSVIGIPIILALCLIGGIPFLIFVLAIGVYSFFEFSQILLKKNISVNIFIGGLSVAAIIINFYANFIEFEILSVFIILTLLLFELFNNKQSAVYNLGGTLLGVFYIGYFSSFLILIRQYFNTTEIFYNTGGYLIISLFATIWICDSAAFFLGTAFGKHKLFPRVSPQKSWEGAIAGFVFAILTMITAKAIILDSLSWTNVIWIGILIGIFGQFGDLVESLLKRDVGVKDSSSIIPGHGGVFDRFDSLLFTAPVVYLYLHFFVQNI